MTNRLILRADHACHLRGRSPQNPNFWWISHSHAKTVECREIWEYAWSYRSPTHKRQGPITQNFAHGTAQFAFQLCIRVVQYLTGWLITTMHHLWRRCLGAFVWGCEVYWWSLQLVVDLFVLPRSDSGDSSYRRDATDSQYRHLFICRIRSFFFSNKCNTTIQVSIGV